MSARFVAGCGAALALVAAAVATPHVVVDRTIVADRTFLQARLVDAPAAAVVKGYSWVRAGRQVAVTWDLAIDPARQEVLGVYEVTLTYAASDQDTSLQTATTTVGIPGLPNNSAVAPLDPNFHSDLTGTPSFLVPLADEGYYLVADGYFNRHRADGSVDPTFTVRYSDLSQAQIRSLTAQADGKVVVVSDGPRDSGTYSALRLGADGAPDPTFRPSAEFLANARGAQLLADGRWLVIVASAANGATTFTARRYLNDGTADQSYPADVLFTTTDPVQGGQAYPNYAPVVFAFDPTGAIYAAARHGDVSISTLHVFSGKSRLFRFNADGTRDSDFAPVDYDPITAMRVAPAGVVVRTTTSIWCRPGPLYTTTHLLRLRFDGTVDASYTPTTLSGVSADEVRTTDPIADVLDSVDLLADGSVIACAKGRFGRFGLIRFAPDGARDPNFAAELGFGATMVNQIAALPSGAVLICGSFTQLDGVNAANIARVIPNRHAVATRLANISARSVTGAGAGPLTLGFVTHGGQRMILARGAGPALATFDITGWLADPQLTLFNGSRSLATNNDWDEPLQAEAVAEAGNAIGAFPFPRGSLDAAVLQPVDAGIHSMQVTAKGSASGVALAEVYDASPSGGAGRIENLSVLSHVAATGELSAGFAITGDIPKTILIRAIGPTLDTFGVATPLPDPKLTLYRAGAAIAANDDWFFGDAVQRYVRETAAAVGAFPLPLSSSYPVISSKDAAIVVTLAPGTYSVLVGDATGTAGNVLIEIYEVP